MRNIRLASLSGLGLAFLTLIGCLGVTDKIKDPACACLANHSAQIADSLGERVREVIRQGTMNGFPEKFARSCDSISYTYATWIDIGPRIGPDSQSALNPMPLQVNLHRRGSQLIYSVRQDSSLIAMDTLDRWWTIVGVSDSAICLPNVENVIVDTLDQRILNRFAFPTWNLVATFAGLTASCDTLQAKLTLSDAIHAQVLDFDLKVIRSSDQIAASATDDSQTFSLLETDPQCRELGLP